VSFLKNIGELILFLLAASVLVIFGTLACAVMADEHQLLHVTTERKLDREGRAFDLTLNDEEGYCLYTRWQSGAVERECYGWPEQGQMIRVVEKMDALVIVAGPDGSFIVDALRNYFRRQRDQYLLVMRMVNDEPRFFYQGRIVTRAHFIANLRMGVPVGVRAIEFN
jgi:hypothetical protein